MNAVDWLYTRITVNGEQLDLAKSKISDYVRKLDLRSGTYRRELIWHLDDGKILKVVFTRLVSMTMSHLGLQRVMFEPLNFSGSVDICAGLDFNIIHEERGECMWSSLRSGEQGFTTAIMARTVNTANKLFSSFSLQSSQPLQLTRVEHDKFIGQSFTMKLPQGEVYRGLAFWDTESYCLPFYMFNNLKAARSLLDFRYKTLPQDMQRAKDVDCEGACYPIATIDGTESCDLWQHSNL
ncbi:hypothetical protein PAECIP111894_01309 [Paenibacillus pseudetheri]|uniref:Glycoside hydrolase family 65 N-terminal domain-containing protein n=1 Tax=Paenibacillus pseudetheri TaxID=2897682 RepID=A0ABM9B9W5_9BACL|nr:hypothetical protein PAECIP111894_01309 [Paenibacillus pseudetheri]